MIWKRRPQRGDPDGILGIMVIGIGMAMATAAGQSGAGVSSGVAMNLGQGTKRLRML